MNTPVGIVQIIGTEFNFSRKSEARQTYILTFNVCGWQKLFRFKLLFTVMSYLIALKGLMMFVGDFHARASLGFGLCITLKSLFTLPTAKLIWCSLAIHTV